MLVKMVIVPFYSEVRTAKDVHKRRSTEVTISEEDIVMQLARTLGPLQSHRA